MSLFKKIYAVALSFVVSAPLLSFAQGDLDFGSTSSLEEVIINIQAFINSTLIPFVIGLAVLVFIFGLFQFITAGGDEDKLKTARGTIIWGIVIIAVMISVWGLINLVVGTFGLGQSAGTLPDYTPEGSNNS